MRQFTWLVIALLIGTTSCSSPGKSTSDDADAGSVTSDTPGGDASADGGTTDDSAADGSDAGDSASDSNDGTNTSGNTLIANHTAAMAYDSIPAAARSAATLATSFLYYEFLSHGSQLDVGLEMLGYGSSSGEFLSTGYGAVRSTSSIGDWYAWSNGSSGYDGMDVLGTGLAGKAKYAMVAWCDGLYETDVNVDPVQRYTEEMARLEGVYPNVTFIYMTAHTDSSDPNVAAQNDEIRAYCSEHGKILYDFEDIESYDPDGAAYPSPGPECLGCANWCTANGCSFSSTFTANQCCTVKESSTCENKWTHTHCLNVEQKGKALIWLLARLSGWDGNP